MDLILWRHADAENSIPDRDRKLTPEGRERAERVAKWLTGRLPGTYRVLASPARRAQETAAALTGGFETLDSLAVGASAEAVLEAAGWSKGGDELVIVVGHQPTLGETAMLALTGHAAPLDLAKGALMWLRRNAHRNEVSVHAAISPELL